MTKFKMGFLQQLKTDKVRGGRRNVGVLEELHCVYGKQSVHYQENDVLTLKPPLLDILNTSLPLD